MAGIRRPTVRELRPGLYVLETELEDFDVRSAVLVGERAAVVWDTLAHPDQMEAVAGLAAGRPLSVVYSHADWDHCWGTCALAEVTEVVAHRSAADRFDSDVRVELERRCGRQPEAWGAVRLVPPTRVFTDARTLDLGDLTLELSALPGHTPDCIVGFVPEWGLLLVGDAVETPLPVVNDGRAVAEWADRLEGWVHGNRIHAVLPSHGPVGGPEIVERNVEYLRALLEGRPRPPAPGAAPFYRETHARNVRLVEAPGG